MVYLFLTPVQQNSGHHIPFPQPENLKSRVPFFSEKLATLLFSGLPLLGPPMLFLQLPPVHSPSTARPPDPDIRSRSSISSRYFCSSRPSTARPPDPGIRSRSPISSLLPRYFCSSRPSTARPPDPDIRSRSSVSRLLPCYFCTSRPSTARPPDPDIRSRSSICSLLPRYFCSSRPSTARPQPVQILTFALAPPSLASSHAISAAPAHSPSTARPPDPDIRSRSSISSLLPCYFCSSRPSTARPPDPDISLAPPSLASSHAISAASARPQPVHRIRTFALAPPSLASSHAISAAPARPQPVLRL